MTRTSPKPDVAYLELTADEVDLPVLEEFLVALDLAGRTAVWSRDGLARVRVYVDAPEDLAPLQRRLCDALRDWQTVLHGGIPEVATGALAYEDWAESWKANFHAFRASRRLIVKPSWESVSSRPGDVVLDLDPGMAFGTGQHGTTQACLGFIDDLHRELGGAVSFLDAGCGSGILSLAAAKLGYAPVVAFDSDPAAVDVARENMRRAGVSGVRLFHGDLADAVLPPSRVVAANILAPVLIAQAPRLVEALAAGPEPAWLVVSGILTEQYPAVRERYEALGLRQQRTETIDEWTSGLLCRGQ